MYKRITFRSMDHSEALEAFANKQLEKIEKIVEQSEREPIYVEMVLTAGFTHAHHRVEIIVKSPHYDLFASHEGPDMYQEINKVIDKMETELRKHKEKRIDERKEGNQHRSLEQIDKNFQVDETDLDSETD
jgi:putative sigma-54 modulation protein